MSARAETSLLRSVAGRPPGRVEHYAFVLWVALLVFLLSLHIPWRDELQSFLVATRTTSWADFWEGLRYERSPPLLYLIQRLLWQLDGARELGVDRVIQLSTVPFSITFVFLWMFRIQGLSTIERILVPFSVFVLREYGVISRAYPLGLTFMALAVCAHQRAKTAFALFLLSLAGTSHTLIFLISAALAIQLAWRHRSRLRESPANSLFWAGLCSLLWILVLASQMAPSDTAFARAADPRVYAVVARMFALLGRSFVAVESILSPYSWNGGGHRVGAGIPVMAAFYYWSRRSGFPFWQYLAVCSGPLLIAGFYYPAVHRHAGLLWLAVFFVDILKGGKPAQGRSWLAILPVAATIIWLFAWAPWKNPPHFIFSDSRNVSEFINQDSRQAYLISEWDFLTMPILARTQVKFWETSRDRSDRYPKFSVRDREISIADWCGLRLNQLMSTAPTARILFLRKRGEPPPPLECGKTRKIYETTLKVDGDESYSLYERAELSGPARPK